MNKIEEKPLLICMTPVRNEAWILHAFLKASSLWADHIVIADQGSTDGSREIAMEYSKVILIENSNPKFDEAQRQKLLIDKVRELKGDKILFALDADEIFSANFMNTKDWKLIVNSKQGDVFWFKWAQVLTDKIHYWVPNNYFPWVFHDDGKEPHGNYAANIHSMRIPYPIEEKHMYYVDDFKVLHFGEYNIKRNESKQRFYQFVDFDNNNRNITSLSRTYKKWTGDHKYLQIPEKWIYNQASNGFDLFNEIHTNEQPYFDNYILELISEYGFERYKKLDVWDKAFLKSYNIIDPRPFWIKLIHQYYRITNRYTTSYLIRGIDKILKKSGI